MNKQNRSRVIDTENVLTVAKWEVMLGEWVKKKGIKKCKLVVTQISWGCKVHHREYSQCYPNNCTGVRCVQALSG